MVRVNLRDTVALGADHVETALCTDGGNNTNFDFSLQWRYWVTAASGNYLMAQNWVPSGVPTENDNLIIDFGNPGLGYNVIDAPSNVQPGRDGEPSRVARLILGGGPTAVSLLFQKMNGVMEFTKDFVVLTNGVALHYGSANPPVQRVDIVVGRNFFLGNGATVDARGRGYPNASGPGYLRPGATGAGGNTGGSHGGKSGWQNARWDQLSYGSITEPVTHGSGGSNQRGGGVIRLTVAGRSSVFGSIDANGNGIYDASGAGGGAGGSVWITTGRLVGDGRISADGGYGYAPYPTMLNAGSMHGAGGRVAVYLTEGDSFDNVRITASGLQGDSITSLNGSGSGSVYLKAASEEHGTCTYDMSYAIAYINGSEISETVTDTAVGNFRLLGGTYAVLTLTNQTLTVFGDWENRGTFIATNGTSTVEFAGTGASRILGNTRFSNLVATNAIPKTMGKTLAFEAGSEMQVANALILKDVTVTSTDAGNVAYLALLQNAAQDILRVRVKDSNAYGKSGNGLQLLAYPVSEDLGGNDNWKFVPSPGTVILIR